MRRTFFLLALVVAATRTGQGATVTYDFAQGIPADFSVFNESGLYNVEDGGENIQISKPADDGSISPTDFISAGIESDFTIDGDYTVTVDFGLIDLPTVSGPRLNESLLSVATSESNVSVLRFRLGGSNLVETFFAPASIAGGAQPTTITNGKYRLIRSGDTITGSFAPSGSVTFTTLYSHTDPVYGGPTRIRLLAAQGKNSPEDTRSTTSLDITFDNLVIETEVFLIPGDADGDGHVDGIDYLIWAANFGDNPANDPPGSPFNGDFNEDSVVSGLDYLIWAGNFGQGPNDSLAVPEPQALWTLCLSVFTVAMSWPRGLRGKSAPTSA